jgi:hypothetical protein
MMMMKIKLKLFVVYVCLLHDKEGKKNIPRIKNENANHRHITMIIGDDEVFV